MPRKKKEDGFLTPQGRYDAANAQKYTVKVIKTTEADIYKRLEAQTNKSGYIKALIRKDIAENPEK